jgi:long-chain-fatty-acid--CoA ligase ACSBG
VRGRHVMMGYLANPKIGKAHLEEMKTKNEETIDAEGWLHTGDKATMNKQGMVRITGRYKELIIGAGGENIAPVPIEDWIKGNYPAVSNVVMIGDKKKYNTILVTLKCKGANGESPGTDELDYTFTKDVNPNVTSVKAATTDPAFNKYVENAIKAVNANPQVCISNACKIQKFTILPRDFSLATGEFTPTLKCKRGDVNKIWQKEIDAMY